MDVLRKFVASEDCDGYRRCDWGRVVEDQSQIYIWTFWAHEAAHGHYADGEPHRSLYEKLNQLSTTRVTVKLIQYDQSRCYSRCCLDACWPSITTIHFEGILSANQRDAIMWVEPVTRRGPITDQYLISYPSTGFLLHESCNGLDNAAGDMFGILDYWKNPFLEEEIKTRGGGKVCRGSDNARHIIPKYFAKDMKALGCNKFEMRHMRFTEVYKEKVELLPTDVVKCKSTEYDWEAGRRSWPGERKMWVGQFGGNRGVQAPRSNKRERKRESRVGSVLRTA